MAIPDDFYPTLPHTSFLDDLFDASAGSGGKCERDLPDPTVEERAVGTILSWLRYKKKSIEWTRQYSCAPSPKGYIVKGKGWWMPSPSEACSCDVRVYNYTLTDDPFTGKVATKMSAHPYAWVEHCKTLEHCTYLAQRRLPHVVTLVPFTSLSIMVTALVKDTVLLLSDEEAPLIRLFFKDWCEGSITRCVYSGGGVTVPQASSTLTGGGVL